MNELKVFDERELSGIEFRMYGTKENPLFLAKDVAEWIDYAFKDKSKGTRNVNMMLQTIDDEKLVARMEWCHQVKIEKCGFQRNRLRICV